MADSGYINYFDILELPEDAKPGDVRKTYRKKMKNLVQEIARVEITEDRRDRYLLDLARLNAAFYILRDNDRRARYIEDRERVMRLEKEWREAVDAGREKTDHLRRQFDNALRHFLSVWMEEVMLEAGRDRECVEASHWDPYHERHAGRVLREYRQRLYHEIHERLPYYDVSRPEIDWDERTKTAAALIRGKG
jgi:curved DNA-binding protein CbpA